MCDLIHEAPRPQHRRSLIGLTDLVHGEAGRRRSADRQLRPKGLLNHPIEIYRDLIRRCIHKLKSVRYGCLHGIGTLPLREVGQIDARMKIGRVRCDEERTRTAHANRHRVVGSIHQIAVRCILDRHRNRIRPLHGRVLIVHHIEPEHDRHNEGGNFCGQIVLHNAPKPRHHFFLQLRTSSQMDDPELYANAGVRMCVS